MLWLEGWSDPLTCSVASLPGTEVLLLRAALFGDNVPLLHAFPLGLAAAAVLESPVPPSLLVPTHQSPGSAQGSLASA